jgi:dolichyl-phosphate beta-glucosyltransferase
MTTDAPPRLTLLLPVYNEAPRIERSLDTLAEHARALRESYEILCVDDGSRDESVAILRRRAAADPRIRLVESTPNRGKGAAIRTGFEHARGERIVFMDVDLSTDLAATAPVLAALDAGADVVLGSRHHRSATIRQRQPPVREALGKLFRRATGVALARGDFDFTCGFKGFRREAARAIGARLTIERWTFDVEIVVIARALGLRIEQVPVVWRHEGGSKVRVLHAVLTSLRDLVKITLRRAAGRYR